MIDWTELNTAKFAYEMSSTAVKNLTDQLRMVCFHEKQRIREANKPELDAITFRLGFLGREWRELRAQLQLVPRTSSDLIRRRGFYLALAVVLGFAALIAAHFSLSPFGLGWEAWVFSVGLCAIGGFWTHAILERHNTTRIMRCVFIGALLASLAGLITLAILRGDIVVLHLQNALASTAMNPDVLSSISTEVVRFYTGAARKLQWFFALLTVAMELGMGLAIFEALKTDVSSRGEAETIVKRIKAIELETPELVGRQTFLLNQPEAFEQEFLRNAHVGLLDTAQQRSLGWLSRFGALLLFVTALIGNVTAQPLHLVLGDDLSLSEKSANYTAGTEHERNVEAAAQLISHLPPGAELSVYGITNDSFSRPLILLSGHIPSDRGPLEFIDEVQIAKNLLAVRMRKTVQSVPPSFRTTDALGFFVLAGQILREAPPGRHVLVAYSDLRNSASPVNIESVKLVPLASTIRTVARQHLLPDLKGVDVYLYGVHAIGKDVAYWNSLRDFWREYFKRSGANLRVISMMREVPDLNHIP